MSDEILELTKDEKLYMSIVQMGEVTDWCIRRDEDVSLTVNTVQQFVNVLPLSEMICVNASMIKDEMRRKGVEKFGLMDGIVLASAMSVNHRLLTMDEDFKMSDLAVVLG